MAGQVVNRAPIRVVLLGPLMLGLLHPARGVSQPQPVSPFPPPFPSTPEPPLADPAAGAPPASPPQEMVPFPQEPGPFPPIRQASAESIVFPPTPVVGIRVHAPAIAPNGRELTYRFVVNNPSRANASRVHVRATLPPHTKLVKSSPEAKVAEKELHWDLQTLRAGASREITVVLDPQPEAAEVKLCARVSFEHGQCVITRLSRPEISLKKEAPAEAVLFDPLTCRIAVTNPGKVPVANVEVVETLGEGLEFEQVLTPVGGVPPDQPASTTNEARTVRTWILGTLAPGQTRLLQYRALPRKTGRLEASTVVTGSGLRQEKKSAFTVLEPKLKIEAKGPAESYVDQPSAYQIVVTNLGTATLNNVRVRADIPPGARAVKISSEGQIFGKEAQWVVTRMSPGDSRTLSLTVRATQPGERTLDLSVRADRGLEQRAAVTTKFIGVAALDWKIVGNPPTAAVGETIRYTAEVKNQGSAPAENVSVRVGLPEAVKLLRAEPADPPPVTGADLVQFPPRTIAPGATVLYTLTVEAVKPAQAVFRFEMTADHLEKSSPVRNEPSTTIRGE